MLVKNGSLAMLFDWLLLLLEPNFYNFRKKITESHLIEEPETTTGHVGWDVAGRVAGFTFG
jgi:hypothetical protein